MINRIKELFESNPKQMWTISFLLLVIVIFTPVSISEYNHYKDKEARKQWDFEWKEIERNREEQEKFKNTVKDEYTVVYVESEDGYDVDKDDNMFSTRWLWFNIPDQQKNIAFNYNGKEAIDSEGKPLKKGDTYIVKCNASGEVLEIERVWFPKE